jgi:hypothetical protein
MIPRAGDTWSTHLSSVSDDVSMTIVFVEFFPNTRSWSVYVNHTIGGPIFTFMNMSQVDDLYGDPEGSGMLLVSRL